MNADVAQSLLAGWLSGAAAGLAMTALIFVAAARTPSLAARLPLQGHLGVLGIVVANGLVLGLTLVGLLLGAAYHSTSYPEVGRFPLAVAAGVAAMAAFYLVVRGRVRSAEAPAVLGGLVIAGLAFAGMLPWLATLDA